MDVEALKSTFGYKEQDFIKFCNNNTSIPKGTFQIKKRGTSYYWYYTLSVQSNDRVKYLCKAYEGLENKLNSFELALKLLKNKYSNNMQDNFNAQIPSGDLKNKWTSIIK